MYTIKVNGNQEFKTELKHQNGNIFGTLNGKEFSADIIKIRDDVYHLLKDDISCVVEAKEYANKTMSLINTNFNATVGINSGILAGATFGLFSPIVTAVLHNGTTIGLLLNSIKGVKLK